MEGEHEVRLWNDQSGVYAGREFEPGERVMDVEGDISPQPSRYSIQIGVDRHVHPWGPDTPWMYLNHSCRPNLAYDSASAGMVAIELIRPGDQLTFNYLTTEWEMAEAFDCACGDPQCFGRIAGYRHLDAEARDRLAGDRVPHIHRLRATEAIRHSGDTVPEPSDQR